ncbi:MAG: hypothetical protein MR266_00700 [Erysipelotrichaceae bacterium]|nr:hypothetical protein [Erysipelotrichaceae bacterium]
MFYLLEVSNTYNDTSWELTFYFVASLALLIGIFWTYYNVFIKKNKKKKTELKENIIYNNPEDTIEESYKDTKRRKRK